MKKFQVAVVGINTIFGGTSALLLKQSPFIKCLKLYDQRNLEAAVDLCAINTQCNVKMYLGNEQLEKAFEGADIIVISDESNEAVMSLDSHLMMAAGNYKNYAKAIARASPQAIIVVASTPVNNLLPIMSQLLVKQGCYNHNKVVGSTLVDTIRASSILASHLNLDPKDVVLPVIGGSSERTRVPVFSQSRPFFSLRKDEKTNLIMNIRRGDVQVLANKGSPEVLNRAYSTVRFLNSIMAGLRGDPNVTDIALCRTDQVPGVDYFSLPVIFGKDGIVKRFGVPKTTDVEDEMVEEAIKHVKKDADKAAYIVRGSIELPEQKYLSSNDRASSQKEMFDLYVKSLSRPVDNKLDSISDCDTKKPTNYSFKKLINSGSTINPKSIPDSGSFQPRVLKNGASEDSFLKSTGFFTSPLQNPILILEPMECPLAPRNSEKNSELLDCEEGDIEVEENYILHEENLARNGKGNTVYSDGRKKIGAEITQTPKNPSFPSDFTRMKMTDPIAKLKNQVGGGGSVQNNHIHPSRVFKTPEQLSHHRGQPIAEKHDETHQQGTSRSKTLHQPTMRNKKGIEREIEEEEITPENERLTGCGAEEYSELEIDTEKSHTSFLYDARSEQALPVYNTYCRKTPVKPQKDFQEVFKEKDEHQENIIDDSKYTESVKDEKYRKMVNRLFKNLGGLNEGVYLPLKSSDRPKSRCRQSFTESVVRSKSHWASTDQPLQGKPPFKIKIDESPFDSEQNVETSNYCLKNMQFKKARKPVPKIKPLFTPSEKYAGSRLSSKKPSESEAQKVESANNKEEKLDIVCAKCQNKISSPSVKTVNTSERKNLEISQRSTESEAKCKKESEIKKVNVSYHSPRADCDRTYTGERYDKNIGALPSPNVNTVTTPSKNTRETELQEERLRKLKEKINQKLIPLLNNNRNMHRSAESEGSRNLANSGSISVSSIRSADSLDPSYYERNTKSKEKTFSAEKTVGTPFVVGKEAVGSRKEENVCDPRNSIQHPEAKWQGIPFVVKSEDSKAEKKYGENGPDRPVDGKRREANNKKVSKINNKLQLLRTNSELITKPEIGEKIAELIDSEEIVKDRKQARLKKIILDLRSEDVQSYMQSRIKDNFERSQQREMIPNATSNEEKEKRTNNGERDDKSTPSMDLEIIKREIIDSSSNQVQSKSQPSSQTSHSAPVSTSKPDSSADVKKTTHLDSQLSEKKKGIIQSSKADPDHKTLSEKAALEVEVHAKSDDQLEAVTASSDIYATTPSEEQKDATMQHIETIPTRTNQPVQNNSDKSPRTTNQTANVSRDPLVASKSESHLKPNPILSLILETPKQLNKLQLLSKAREQKLNFPNGNGPMDGKLRTIWEKTLNRKTLSTTPNERKSRPTSPKDVYPAGSLGKKSAAVKMAKVSNLSKPPRYKVKLKAGKTSNILDGMTFPPRKIRRKTHNNLLKELAATATQREQRQTAEFPEKTVRRGRSLDPLDQVQLYKKVIKEGTSYENLLGDESFGSLSAEYARDGEKFARLASEVIMKRKLTRPQTESSNRKPDSFMNRSRMINKTQKRQSSFRSVRNLRNQWNDYSPGNNSERESRIRKTADDVQSKLISMPHVRHQMEHLELPLGPLEVQTGLAPLSFGRSSTFPFTDNSWESALFNEYVRPNLLPSLKDTRETFYLEER